MTPRPHYHPCVSCRSAVFCNKAGEHEGPTCFECRRIDTDKLRQVSA